jgi:hypothetical protein
MTAWKLFEVETPDLRTIRHRHESLEAAKKALLPGYTLKGEVLGASANDKGGFTDPTEPGTKSIMETLLETRGDVLMKWLADHGFKPAQNEEISEADK